jgi:hypothetical protein
VRNAFSASQRSASAVDSGRRFGGDLFLFPRGWERRYGYRPLLLETLVDAQRFRGTCYRAANWIHVGPTQGRGRMDREHRAAGLAVKDIYLYPLRRDVQRELCRNTPRDRS